MYLHLPIYNYKIQYLQFTFTNVNTEQIPVCYLATVLLRVYKATLILDETLHIILTEN